MKWDGWLIQANDESQTWPDFVSSEESSHKFQMKENCYEQLVSTAKHARVNNPSLGYLHLVPRRANNTLVSLKISPHAPVSVCWMNSWWQVYRPDWKLTIRQCLSPPTLGLSRSPPCRVTISCCVSPACLPASALLPRIFVLAEKTYCSRQSLQLAEQKWSLYQTEYSLNICSSFARCKSVLQSCLQTPCNPVHPEGTVFWGWENDSSAWTSEMEWCGPAPTKHDRSHSFCILQNLPQITLLFHNTNVKNLNTSNMYFDCYMYTFKKDVQHRMCHFVLNKQKGQHKSSWKNKLFTNEKWLTEPLW